MDLKSEKKSKPRQLKNSLCRFFSYSSNRTKSKKENRKASRWGFLYLKKLFLQRFFIFLLIFVWLFFGWLHVQEVHAATLPTLRPVTPDGTNDGDAVNENDSIIDLYASIDDDPDSSDTADYVNNDARTSASVFLNLTDMPLDFFSMDSLHIDFYLNAPSLSFVDDTCTLDAQVYQSDELTTLTDSVQLATEITGAGYYSLDFSSVIAGNKDIWDGARLKLSWTYVQNASPDDGEVYTAAVELDGAYTTPILDQNHYRWRDDSTLLNTTGGWLEDEDVIATSSIGDVTRLRVEIANTGDAAAIGTQYLLEYATSTSGSWYTVPTTTVSSPFEMVDSFQYADGASTTVSFLTATGTFATGTAVEDPSNKTAAFDLTNNYYTEFEYAIEATVNVQDLTTYYFRLTNNSTTTNFLYTVYPKFALNLPTDLTVDIVDAGGISVTNASTTMEAVDFSFPYQIATGTLGVSDQKIRVENRTTNSQWDLTIAANSSTAFWDGANDDYDFNDPTADAGDGADNDSLGGQMTIDALGSALGGTCSTTDITKGSSASFSEGTTSSITLLTAGSSADTDCYWDLTDVSASQTIPAEQSASDYNIDMILTVTAI